MRTTEPAQLYRTDVLYDNCRNPKPRKIPFREMLPMQLKDRISGKKGKSSDVCCLPEMMKLFTCLNKMEFDSSKCPNEVKAFETCYTDTLKEKAACKAMGNKGILIPGQSLDQMTPQQINTMLRKYPIQQFMKKIQW